jgi:signal transduction histidine kinase
MNRSSALDEVLERDAQVLCRLWSQVPREFQALDAGIEELVHAATQRGDPRLAALSCAWEAVHIAYRRTYDAGMDSRLDSLVAEVRCVGWSRAEALLDAAMAFRVHFLQGNLADAIERLALQGPADRDLRPAAERFWTDAFACILNSQVGNFDAAIEAGLVACRLADESRLDLCIASGHGALSYALLRMGDVGGAATVLTEGLAAETRLDGGRPGRGFLHNLLLSLALTEQLTEANALVLAHPHVLERDYMGGNPSLRCTVAWVWSLQGSHAQALALLDADAHPPEIDGEGREIAANRAWMSASVWQRAGQTARARRALQAFEAHRAAKGWTLSPLNTTQLMRVYSEVCEAEGDLRGALDALKRSQAACFQWVGSSVRVRLQALHLQSPAPQASADRLKQRLAAVAQASAMAPVDAVHTPPRISRHLAHVTHEMRNPLNGVIGMTSLLALSDLNARQRRYVEVVEVSAQMLLALCNDTLDMAKIEAGRFELNPRPMALGSLLNEVLRMFEHQVNLDHVALRLQLDPALPPSVTGDRLRLQQVLMNLLGNAAKFTQHGAITVVARWWPDNAGNSGRLHLAVNDTGPGLDGHQRARLFEEFSQADAGVAERHGGTGLGLALCRKLVELMGGEIGVDSELGQGSSFWFELPLAVADATPTVAV